MNDDEPRRIYIGNYEGGTTHLIIPAPVLARADAALAAERKRREHEADMARLRVLQAARNQGRLKKALRAVFGRARGRSR
jgi:hypothetical protein